MKRLILLRHAKAERSAPAGGDFDRALSERGRVDAAAAGRRLSAAGLIPDVALVSAARRTLETWEKASPMLPDARVERRRDLYNASAKALRRAAEAADGETVLILAHNPGLHELAAELAEEAALIEPEVKARLAEGFPTAAAAAFELDPGRTGCLGLFAPDDGGGDA